jgi:hypothetical protein
LVISTAFHVCLSTQDPLAILGKINHSATNVACFTHMGNALNSALGFFSTTGVNMPNFTVRKFP